MRRTRSSHLRCSANMLKAVDVSSLRRRRSRAAASLLSPRSGSLREGGVGSGSIEVLEALDVLRKKSNAQAEEILPIEKLIADAYSAIDKAIQVGTLHGNTGARRKSRLARRKKAVEIHHGWYIPAAAAA